MRAADTQEVRSGVGQGRQSVWTDLGRAYPAILCLLCSSPCRRERLGSAGVISGMWSQLRRLLRWCRCRKRKQQRGHSATENRSEGEKATSPHQAVDQNSLRK